MFDIWIEKARKKMFGRFEAELEEAELKGESRKVENFLIRVMPNFIANVTIFLGLVYIFTHLAEKYGIQRVAIGMGVIIILTLRGINKTLNQAT